MDSLHFYNVLFDISYCLKISKCHDGWTDIFEFFSLPDSYFIFQRILDVFIFRRLRQDPRHEDLNETGGFRIEDRNTCTQMIEETLQNSL